MCGKENCREMNKTGKRLWISISCLILFFGMMMLYIYIAGKKTGEGVESAKECEVEETGEENDSFRQAEGFDNPIDELYLPMILADGREDKAAVLEMYENTWRGQLEAYLEDYGSRCSYAKDQEMAEEYLAAVCQAVDAQKNLMEYMGVGAEERLWHSAQIYRCAFIKDIRGTFTDDTDRQYALSMYEGCEAEIRARQEAFDLEWCNELGKLTMVLYEDLDAEGRHLAGIWQQSREDWKAAADARFWKAPEELNAQQEDESFWENGTGAALMEKDGWINRLYCQQLNSMIEKMYVQGFRVNEQLSIYPVKEGVQDDGLCWADEYVKESVYSEIRSFYDAVPSREEIRNLRDYHICDYGTEREPVWVLEKAAEEFLIKAQVLPACYASEEIKDSYEKLIGVEPPEQFYIGLMKGEPVLLYYNRCLQEEDGFVHELALCISDEKETLWGGDCLIYYDENEDAFRFSD